MNDAHFHLVVNHLPIIFPLVGVIILITGLIAKSEAVKRTAYLVFSIGAISAIAAMTSGEGAEEVVENINGISESFIEKHEDAAKLFALLSYVLGGLSLIGLWASFRQKTFSSIVSIAVLGMAIIVLVFAKQTGTTGGEIRHDEIRSGTSTTQIPVDNDDDDD